MVLLKSREGSDSYYDVVVSTFHYGSIKMVESYALILQILQSTFHYGSIKIDNKRSNQT